jgi:cysteine synthase
METGHSASYKRLHSRIQVLSSLDIEDSELMLRETEKIVQGTPLLEFQDEELQEILQIREHYGSRIFAKVLSETPGESHYDYCFPRLLFFLEQQGIISPQKTKHLIEPTSCNAGVSLSWVAKMKGYDTEIIIPEVLPTARASRVHEEATSVTLASSDSGFIKGMNHKLKRRMVELRKANTDFYCPNHSEIEQTPQTFSVIGEEVNRQLPSDANLDVFIGALGNGTTIKGIAPALEKEHQAIECVGFEDAGEKVTLIGAGGRQGMQMRFVDELKESRLLVQQLQENDWKELFEGFNRGKKRKETIGHTSAAALSVARTLIQQRKQALNILVLFYDKADRYGHTIVRSDDSVYLGNENWSDLA